MDQSTNSIALVSPKFFGFNKETAKSNQFSDSSIADKKNKNQSINIKKLALKEFSNFKKHISKKVHITELNPPVNGLDGIFPNNWIVSFQDKTMDIFSMADPSRRIEKTEENIALLSKQFQIKNDFTSFETQNLFLEGTGSLVLDRQHKIAYACISPRTSIELATLWANKRDFKLITFMANASNKPIYHTNVVMFLGSKLCFLGTESIIDSPRLEEQITHTHQIIKLSSSQVNKFCANVIELIDFEGNHFLAMSSTAFNNLKNWQLDMIYKSGLYIEQFSIPTIETIGGGSLRCMILELF